MATVEIPSAITAEEMADMEEVCRLIAEGNASPIPRCGNASTSGPSKCGAMLEKHGITNIAVDLIREVRDEE